MKIHEYQAKELLKEYGAPVPEGILCTEPGEVKAAADTILPCVLKAQVHSGARGKAGGVKFAKTAEEAESLAKQMLGMKLVTRQTGPEGRIVRKILVTEAVNVKKEYYLSVTGDSRNAGLMIIGSSEGGTEIEETAKEHPEAIVQVPVSAVEGLKRYEMIETADRMQIPEHLRRSFYAVLSAMVKLYLDKDCSLVEINPLVITEEETLLCLDAKINFDDNALFRHPDITEMRDIAEEDEKEYEASKYDLNYVSLDGNIGCLVNGAGLAMATMDIIRKFGGSPSNFLDVGGSATAEKVAAAFRILLSNPNVKAIFINIFGGIMKCDIIAEGVVAAAKETGLPVPLVVRLEGTNVEKGRKILRASGMNITAASDMADGAHKAVLLANGGETA